MKYILLFLSLFIFALPANAASLDYSSFRLISVLHEGRVKPLDSYARIKLREFSGHEHGAVQWLSETLFDPASASAKPLFQIHSPNIKILLKLDAEQKIFSFDELQAALQSEEKTITNLMKLPFETLTPEQKELLQLQDHVAGYGKLLRSFSAVLPLQLELPKKYPADGEPNYVLLMDNEAALLKDLQRLIRRKGSDPKYYNDEDKKLAALGFGLQQIRNGGEGNDEFKVVAGPVLKSPWQSILEGNIALDDWKTLANFYRAGDSKSFGDTAEKIAGHAGFKFRLEVFYNSIKPFHAALILYVLSLALAVAATFRPLPILEKLSLLSISTGLAAHLFGILTRIIVLGRPPVGTLYEAVLFVSFICAATGLTLYIRRQNGPAIFAGLISAVALLTIAPALLQTGESMEMLVAVLNTNFWLSTHVLCITGGYAISILTGCLAHFFLFETARDQNTLPIQKSVYGFSLAALLLTAVGTALGGIWADQSWGRFWGWDPKENGALLIVLWLIWLQHGRVSGKLSPLAFAAGAAFLNVIVALAWFGVNLLSVGLHSYGFTSGIAAGLFAFCVGEILFIATLWFYAHKEEYDAD